MDCLVSPFVGGLGINFYLIRCVAFEGMSHFWVQLGYKNKGIYVVEFT